MLESFLRLETYSSVRVDLICTSLIAWIEVKNGLSEIFKHYTYGLILRFDIALLFSRKSESFYLIYALCPYSPPSVSPRERRVFYVYSERCFS